MLIRRVTALFTSKGSDEEAPIPDFAYLLFKDKLWYAQYPVTKMLGLPKGYLAARSSNLTKSNYKISLKDTDTIIVSKIGLSYSIGTGDGKPVRFLHGPAVCRFVYDHWQAYGTYPRKLNAENFRRFRILTLAHRLGLKHLHVANSLMLSNYLNHLKKKSKDDFDNELESMRRGEVALPLSPDPSKLSLHEACKHLNLWTTDGYPHLDYLIMLLSLTEIQLDANLCVSPEDLPKLRDLCRDSVMFDEVREPFSKLERAIDLRKLGQI